MVAPMNTPKPQRSTRIRTRWKVITAALAGVLAIVLGAGVAFAADNHLAYGTTFVDGADALTDDFGDHYNELGHSLCNGCSDSWHTDLVVMWQAILYAEGFLSCSGIDGEFGSGTAAATKKWQSRYGLSADGIVGGATWAKADNYLAWAASTGSEVHYRSAVTGGKVAFYRGTWTLYRDGGAYELDAATPNNWTTTAVFNGGNRVQFKQLTVTVGC
jgi:Putative peptidoglycan binding domain